MDILLLEQRIAKISSHQKFQSSRAAKICSRKLQKIVNPQNTVLRVRSFEMIRISISDPRSLGSWRIKGTDKSFSRAVSSVPLMRHDPSDLGSLIRIRIRIIPKERTLNSRKIFKHGIYYYYYFLWSAVMHLNL